MTYNYFQKNIEQIKKYNTESFSEPVKNEYYKNFEEFQNFCLKFEIIIDKFDSKSQILTMILFYLYLDSKYSKMYTYYNIRVIQLFFYTKNKDKPNYIKIKDKKYISEKIDKIIIIFLKKTKQKCDKFSFYDNLPNCFLSFLTEKGTNQANFRFIGKEYALLIIILFYEKLLLSQNTWFIIDTNYDVYNYLNKENTKEIECNDSFFMAKKNTYFLDIMNKINDNKAEESIGHLAYNEFKKISKKENNFINEIDLNISKKVTEFQKCIQMISEKIYCYNLKFIDENKPNDYYFPKSKYFSKFLKNMNKFKYLDIKIQLYMIILFYLNLADQLEIPLYDYINYIQKLLFYEKIINEDKCFGILQEKNILYSIIKDIIKLSIKTKEKNDIKKSINICNSVTIKEFDDFLEKNNTNKATLNKLNESKVLIIITLFYGYLIILKYNWCFIFIDKQFDIDKHLYKNSLEIDQKFLVVQEKNNDIEYMKSISEKYRYLPQIKMIINHFYKYSNKNNSYIIQNFFFIKQKKHKIIYI